MIWYVLRISPNGNNEELTRVVGTLEAPTHYRAMGEAARRFEGARLRWRRDKEPVRGVPYMIVQSKISYEIEQEEEETIRAGRMKKRHPMRR